MRKLLSSVLGFLCLALLLESGTTTAQTCVDHPARNLMAGNLVNTLLNPPKGEDAEFYTSAGGMPNIMFLTDTSGSMERLPPNGPAFLGGTEPTLPAGHLLATPGTATAQNSAYNDHTRVVGCGIDPVFKTTSNVGDNPMLQVIMGRRFYSPCGRSKSDLTKAASDPSSIGDLYRGHVGLVTGGLDYGDESSVCPQWTPSDSFHTGDPGYDPDFYSSTPTATAVGSKAAYFGRDLIFHDSMYNDPAYSTNTLKFGHNFGKGWSDSAVYPARVGGANATIDTFCNSLDPTNTWMQGSLKVTEICKTCLQQAGWFYDGILLQQDFEGFNDKQYPSIWYTGNYLSFFPPKFVIARKIVKDVMAEQSKVRLAVAHFGSDGAIKDTDFKPGCDQPDQSMSSSDRQQIVTSVNGYSFAGGTPLSNAILDIGQYYHTKTLPWWNRDAAEESGNSDINYSICYSCQTSSLIVLTDGAPSVNDGSAGRTLPAGTVTAAQVASGTYAGNTSTGVLGLGTSICPTCGDPDFTGSNDYKNNGARAAWYLNNLDLRLNTETTRDCAMNGGKQVLSTYTVGFATSQLPDANKILANIASAGGGLFVSADNAEVLKDSIGNIIEYINNRETSFSVATVSTLQTTAGRTVIVPRFEPVKGAHYRGHLLRFDLFSEFVNTCAEKSDGSGAGDLDCDGHCSSVFLQDKDGDFVVEDGAGTFVKTDPGNVAACSVAPLCDVASPPGGKSCASAAGAEATSWWDAGELLAGEPADAPTSQKWKSRRVFTVVDSSADGKIGYSDTTIRLDPSDDIVLDALVPYLGLGSESVCNQMAAVLSTAGNSARAMAVAPAVTTADSLRECARTLVRYILGADVFNSAGKAKTTYVATAEDALWDCQWLLGDIFHSSPVVVDPPLPRTGVLCKNGLSIQCLESLWATPTDGGTDGYDGYSLSATYVNRPKITLVGANDGLLHAFAVGTWHGNTTPGEHSDSADDPDTTALDESLPPFNGYFDKGTGSEVWAFLPPDMLSKKSRSTPSPRSTSSSWTGTPGSGTSGWTGARTASPPPPPRTTSSRSRSSTPSPWWASGGAARTSSPSTSPTPPPRAGPRSSCGSTRSRTARRRWSSARPTTTRCRAPRPSGRSASRLTRTIRRSPGTPRPSPWARRTSTTTSAG